MGLWLWHDSIPNPNSYLVFSGFGKHHIHTTYQIHIPKGNTTTYLPHTLPDPLFSSWRERDTIQDWEEREGSVDGSGKVNHEHEQEKEKDVSASYYHIISTSLSFIFRQPLALNINIKSQETWYYSEQIHSIRVKGT